MILDTKTKTLEIGNIVYYLDNVELKLMLALANNTYNTTKELTLFVYGSMIKYFNLYALINRFKKRFENVLTVSFSYNSGYILENYVKIK